MMKKLSFRKISILVLTSIVLITTGIQAGALTTQFGNSTHTWLCGVSGAGSQSNYLHMKKQHSSTVKKGSKVDGRTKSARNWANSRLWEYSGCNFYYSNW